jgi:hypothetical protein
MTMPFKSNTFITMALKREYNRTQFICYLLLLFSVSLYRKKS